MLKGLLRAPIKTHRHHGPISVLHRYLHGVVLDLEVSISSAEAVFDLQRACIPLLANSNKSDSDKFLRRLHDDIKALEHLKRYDLAMWRKFSRRTHDGAVAADAKAVQFAKLLEIIAKDGSATAAAALEDLNSMPMHRNN